MEDRGAKSPLRRRFDAALEDVGATHAGHPVFARLVARYGEAHRHYHTLEHVAACLDSLDRYAALAERLPEVELALFFHDTVYDVPARNNEQRSAELARQELLALGVDPQATARIAQQILATEHHRGASADAALVCDADLSILASEASVFDDFEARIRREYKSMPAALYRAGRRRVLEGLLERPRIYQVPLIREKLEHRARANLLRQLNAL